MLSRGATLHSIKDNKRAKSQTRQKRTSTKAVKRIYLLDQEAAPLVYETWIQNNVKAVAGVRILDLAKVN
jgi:hypothetical protein